MWLVVMFDLPVTTKKARQDYTQFRRSLLADGFTMLQYSVYARYCESEDDAAKHRRRVRGSLPPAGQVRIVSITDRQFGKMEIYSAFLHQAPENAPEQMQFL